VTVANPAPVVAASNAVNVTVQAVAADLIVTALTAPSSGTVGGTLQTSMTISNQGNAAAGPFRVGFYLSTDATITTSDTFTQSICNYPSGLAAGASNTCQGGVAVPTNLTAGTYFLGAIADDQAAVGETNENNNARASAAITIAPLPNVDLTITAITAPSSGTVGGLLSVTVTVANQGTVAAGAFRVGLYFSTDTNITTSSDVGAQICNYPSGLGAGATNVCTTTVQVPNTLAPGTYFLGAIADDQGAVAETNESNNTRASAAIAISPANVDLTVTALIVPTSGVAGGTIPVTMTVHNAGSVGIGSFAVGFYFSTDATVTTGDVFSGTICDYPNGLGASTSHTCSGPVRVPATLAAGTYFLGAIADDLGQQAETNENNNTRVSSAISITAPNELEAAMSVSGLGETGETRILTIGSARANSTARPGPPSVAKPTGF
jgi:subtilase family serine protease